MDLERKVLKATIAWIVAVALLYGCSTSGAAAADVALESATSPGADPFTSSLAVTPASELSTEVRAVGLDGPASSAGASAEVGSVEGTAPGLYGGSGDQAVCDARRLVEFLQDDDAKAEAWASTLGIPVASIPEYVTGLTGVFLTADTAVTNHGFKAGLADPFPAVLEAGTAVMVDDTGAPIVRCGCGNPLTPPSEDVFGGDVEYRGTPWEGFDADTIVRVAPGNAVERFELVDLATGEALLLPTGAGTGASASGGEGWVLTVGTEFDWQGNRLLTSPDGVEWTEVASGKQVPTRIVEGDDGWIGVTMDGEVVGSDDLATWEPVATDPPAFGGEPTGPPGAVVVAEGGGVVLSTDVSYDQDVGLRSSRILVQDDPDGEPAVVEDSPFGENPLHRAAYGDGRFLGVADSVFSKDPDARGIFASPDGRTWERLVPWDEITETDEISYGFAYGTITFEDAADPPPDDGPAESDLRSVDWDNRDYEVCSRVFGDGPVTFSNAAAASPEGYGGAGLTATTFGDADGDGIEDVLLTFQCTAGTAAGSAVEFLVFTGEADDPSPLGGRIDANATAKGDITDGTIRVTQTAFLAGDAACCPSGAEETSTWTLQGDRWVSS